MVHKKYIKKNGKIYGPYYYKSKRVGDKVISEYVGENKKNEIPRKAIIIGGLITLVIVFFFLVMLALNSNLFTGNATSNNEKESLSNTDTLTGKTIDEKTLNKLSTNTEEFSQSVRSFKNWIIVRFSMNGEIGEYSYSNSLSQEELESLIEKDKAIWLEKISN
jgi:hypothetical protein